MSFIAERVQIEGLTFDDVLLVPAYSDVLPRDVNLTTRFSRRIELKIPIASNRNSCSSTTGQKKQLTEQVKKTK